MKKIPTWIKSLLTFAIVYLFAFQPIPYYMEVPGNAFGLDGMVEVNGEQSDSPGEFYITTVGVQQVTPLTALSTVLPYRDLLSETELFGEIKDFEEYDVIQKYYMDSSANIATQVAFEAANMDYELQFNGVYVLQVLEESNFSDILKIGDTVTGIDNQRFQSSHDFIEYVSTLPVGETVEIEFERDGELHTASGDLIQLGTGAAGIGIGLVDNTQLQTNPPVDINSGSIGGPSAGLMFSLQIYSQLTGKNIHGTYKIAGTGTISPDGTVGRIGGIDKKIIAADKEDVAYFFAPDDEIPAEVADRYPEIRSNYEVAVETAEKIGTDMKVIPVKTFSDALDFLESLAADQESAEMKNIFSIVEQNQVFIREAALHRIELF